MNSGYEALKKWMGSTAPGTVLLTDVAFVLSLLLIWHLTSKLSSADAGTGSVWTNRMISLIGGLCGWAVGTAFAPYSGRDLTAFHSIGSAVSVFLSGYVVSKLDRYLEQALFRKDGGSNHSWERIGLFTTTFLLVAITVFINRFYAFIDIEPALLPAAAIPFLGSGLS
jgi:hypothetical protein